MNDAWSFHFFLDRCGNSSCIRCGPLYSPEMITDIFICWLEWFGTDSAVGGIIEFPSLFLSQPFKEILLAMCCIQMVAGGKTWSKKFYRLHPLYSVGVLQSIVHNCILRRCNFHMIPVASIGWWRNLMMITWNPRGWQKVNLKVSFWKLDSFIFPNGFSIPLIQPCKQYWQKYLVVVIIIFSQY